MSHVTLAHQGLAAAADKKWDEAIEKLTKALQTSLNPTWLIARSKALINTGRFREALDDADLAWNSAYQRNKRPLMQEAHYRRAVAYFRLGEFANADCCCLLAMRMFKGGSAVEKEEAFKQFTDENGFWTQTLQDALEQAQEEQQEQRKGGAMNLATAAASGEQNKDWRMASTLRLQTLGAMGKLQPDDPARKLTAKLMPKEKELSTSSSQSQPEQAKPAAEPSATTAEKATPKPVVPADTPLRLQDFQSTTNMSVSIFSKGIDKAKFQVNFLPFSARLNPVVYPNGDEKEFVLDLWGEIEPTESKYTVTPNKVELSLKKKTPGKWPQLQGEAKSSGGSEAAKAADQDDEAVEILKQARKKAMDAADAAESKAADTQPAKPADTQPAKPAGPAYPTSSRSGPKDWDKIGDGEDVEDAQDVNFFFKNLYKNATPEQQRAMMKSFTESNGTSLSTDWNDVKDRTVETSPPEGVDAKKW